MHRVIFVNKQPNTPNSISKFDIFTEIWVARSELMIYFCLKTEEEWNSFKEQAF
jgi:hypothetical protein